MATPAAVASDRTKGATPPVQGLRAMVWGGTGAAGGELVRHCLADGRFAEIVVPGRRRAAFDDPRVTQHIVTDFLDMEPHRPLFQRIDVVYWCLGVSQLVEPRKEGYRRITRDFAVAAATVLRQESPDAPMHFLSGMGSSRVGLSPVMWGRVKGEAEKALMDLDLCRLSIWRPTFIHAIEKRENPTGTDKFAAALGLKAIPLLTNSTVNIAQAMVHTTFLDDGHRTYYPWNIDSLARAYRSAQEAC